MENTGLLLEPLIPSILPSYSVATKKNAKKTVYISRVQTANSNMTLFELTKPSNRMCS